MEWVAHMGKTCATHLGLDYRVESEGGRRLGIVGAQLKFLQSISGWVGRWGGRSLCKYYSNAMLVLASYRRQSWPRGFTGATAWAIRYGKRRRRADIEAGSPSSGEMRQGGRLKLRQTMVWMWYVSQSRRGGSANTLSGHTCSPTTNQQYIGWNSP